MIIPESMHGHVLLHRFCFRGGEADILQHIDKQWKKSKRRRGNAYLLQSLLSQSVRGLIYCCAIWLKSELWPECIKVFTLIRIRWIAAYFQIDQSIKFSSNFFRSFQINLFLYNILREMSVFQIGGSPSPSLLRAWSG